jgi:hypothetical protein
MSCDSSPVTCAIRQRLRQPSPARCRHLAGSISSSTTRGQIREEAVADESLLQVATANPLDASKLVFDKALEGLFMDRMDQNGSITARFLDDKDFRGAVSCHLMKQVYEQIRGEALGV